MKAVFEGNDIFNARNYSNEKELVHAYSAVGKINGELREIVTVRAWMGRSRNASTVYASIWVNAGNGGARSGRGTAGGCGYHKLSAAIGDAISSAGIRLYGSAYADSQGMVWEYNDSERKRVKENLKARAWINGVGESAIESALIAIAKACGARGKINIYSHA